jgi:hypothetical protein
MELYKWKPIFPAMHICGCVGPQNGDPVCPCRMPEHNRRKMADQALEFLTKNKPRIRVPAPSRQA